MKYKNRTVTGFVCGVLFFIFSSISVWAAGPEHVGYGGGVSSSSATEQDVSPGYSGDSVSSGDGSQDMEHFRVPPVSVMFFRPVYFGPDASASVTDEVVKEVVHALEAEGHYVKVMDCTAPDDVEEIRKRGWKDRVDYALWGSITLLGNSMSLDFSMLNILDKEGVPASFFSQGVRGSGAVIRDFDSRVRHAILRPYLVKEVKVEGNRRVGTDAILQHVSLKKGDRFSRKVVSSDIKSVYSMGYFNDIQVDSRETLSGRVVTFLVREKPAIRKIRITGNSEIDDEKIREVLTVKPYTVIKEQDLKDNAEKIKALYADKGMAGTTVVANIKPVSEEAADVVFEISEGEKVYIKEIIFEGNKNFDGDDLEDIMEVSEKKPWWTPSLKNIMGMVRGDAGVLKWDALERDLGRISAYYHNHGFIDAKVGRPKVRRKEQDLFVTIPIFEGERYGVGKVDIDEDFFKDKTVLLSDLAIQDEEAFSQEVLRKDIQKINDIYADNGFAFVDIRPDIRKDPEKKVVNIMLRVNTGPKVRFKRIEISGNSVTRDKVIRRELRIRELGLFSATGLRKSNDRLRRLGYFEDVKITPTRDVDPEYMNVNVEVKERQTGTFSIGAGYSSVDKLMLMGEVSQRNFLGRGQTLTLKAILGSTNNRFMLSFFEPYFRDTNFSFGADIYNWRYEYDDYTRDSTGGALHFGYAITDNLRTNFGVRMDYTDMSDYGDNSSVIIQQSREIKTTRALELGFTYDTRNAYYNPSRGWLNTLAFEYAGLGGDSGFFKTEASISYYHPIWWELVGHIHGGAGIVTEIDGKLPIYEKFYLGGMESVRGYKYGYISPTDPVTDERIGGRSMAYLQTECIFPLIKDMGLNGVIFFDMGNVWEDETDYDVGDLRKSVGAGVRWMSPMGPLRVEWGYNVDRAPGDDKSNWEFRMGGNF